MYVGAGFFKSFVLGKKNFEEVRSQPPYNDYDIHACYALTQSALRSGVIRVQDVKRHEECEEKLRKKFGLTQCIVADIESHDGTVIRAEYIAFLIAREVFNNEQPTHGFCIGSGYTILRAAEQTIANPSSHFGTTWIPMMSHTYRDLNKSTTFYTANFIVRLLANFYLGSSALYLPHRRYKNETTESDIETVFMKTAQDATVALTSTNGIGRRSNKQEYPELDYTAPDGRRYYDMTDMYSRLQSEVGEKYIFEYLGYFYDENMKLVGSDELQTELKARVLSVPLDTIQAIRRRGKVYVVGARKYKARPILTLLRHNIVNCLVIDKEIAEWLLANS